MQKTQLSVLNQKAEEIRAETAQLGLVLDEVERHTDCGTYDGEFVIRGWSRTNGACTLSLVIAVGGDPENSSLDLQVHAVYDAGGANEESAICSSSDGCEWAYSRITDESLLAFSDLQIEGDEIVILSSEEFIPALREMVEAFKRRAPLV